MDEDNLCASFSGLLDENEGWIITKNERGKLKIAPCPEDDTNIYEKTRDWIVIAADETKTSNLKLPKCEALKTANIFIRDLLNAQWKDGYFIFKNISFLQVYIAGTLVDWYERGHKFFLTVDDGTSNIRCIIEKEKLSLLKHNIEYDESVIKDRNNVISSATAMIRAACKILEDSVPSGTHDLELGNIVNIYGKMGEYKDNRYIFIEKIVKEPIGTIKHCVHLENMIHLYSNFYT
ncbi:unnamed protein product [Phaedon cochleariae]|uniref:Uncharacterized protein n=1 Tax=Phaedon cochleariae TaxID=80249 RepID=A0A9P0GI27_PHACE|nr:unnamed protein product [Phaedon cochleariae]